MLGEFGEEGGIDLPSIKNLSRSLSCEPPGHPDYFPELESEVPVQALLRSESCPELPSKNSEKPLEQLPRSSPALFRCSDSSASPLPPILEADESAFSGPVFVIDLACLIQVDSHAFNAITLKFNTVFWAQLVEIIGDGDCDYVVFCREDYLNYLLMNECGFILGGKKYEKDSELCSDSILDYSNKLLKIECRYDHSIIVHLIDHNPSDLIQQCKRQNLFVAPTAWCFICDDKLLADSFRRLGHMSLYPDMHYGDLDSSAVELALQLKECVLALDIDDTLLHNIHSNAAGEVVFNPAVIGFIQKLVDRKIVIKELCLVTARYKPKQVIALYRRVLEDEHADIDRKYYEERISKFTGHQRHALSAENIAKLLKKKFDVFKKIKIKYTNKAKICYYPTEVTFTNKIKKAKVLKSRSDEHQCPVVFVENNPAEILMACKHAPLSSFGFRVIAVQEWLQLSGGQLEELMMLVYRDSMRPRL